MKTLRSHNLPLPQPALCERGAGALASMSEWSPKINAAGKPIAAKLAELRPTQMAVGYDGVNDKRSKWRALSDDGKRDFLESHPFSAVLGPGGRYFIVDGHHLALALLKEGVDSAWVRQIDDLSTLDADQFFAALKRRGLICPSGGPQALSQLPRALQDLTDDPFRSLIARLREDCGCPKDPAPFAEFRWADFLRANLKPDLRRSEPSLLLKSAKRLIRAAWCKNPCAACRCADEAAS